MAASVERRMFVLAISIDVVRLESKVLRLGAEADPSGERYAYRS